MPRVYVAGAWPQRQRIRKVIEELTQKGWTVTHDWTKETKTMPVTEKGSCALLDLQGVRDADVLLGVMFKPDYSYRGTWTEIGAALALGHPVILYTPWENSVAPDQWAATPASNVFFYHPEVRRYTTWSAVLHALERFQE